MSDIEKFRNDVQVLRDTGTQVQKDFASCGLDPGLEGPGLVSYELLLTRVLDQLEEALRRQGVFQNLLYRIDIPESSFVRLKESSENFMEDLGKMILEREFMKVITRKLYGKH
jgi:hypothetical protein